MVPLLQKILPGSACSAPGTFKLWTQTFQIFKNPSSSRNIKEESYYLFFRTICHIPQRVQEELASSGPMIVPMGPALTTSGGLNGWLDFGSRGTLYKSGMRDATEPTDFFHS